MLAQYRGIKARFPDAIVLFRLGDFYETFENDAKIAARELELALTARSFAKGVRLPMAGVPHHHVQAYLGKLIERGYKVALVEQLEDPNKVKRSDLYPRGRERRYRAGTVDVSRGDERDEPNLEPRLAAQPDRPRRGRARHIDL